MRHVLRHLSAPCPVKLARPTNAIERVQGCQGLDQLQKGCGRMAEMEALQAAPETVMRWSRPRSRAHAIAPLRDLLGRPQANLQREAS